MSDYEKTRFKKQIEIKRNHDYEVHAPAPEKSATKAPAYTKADYLKFHEEFLGRMSEITIAKNADYTGHSDDPFANFRIVETNGICTTEQGFLTRMSDKMSRLASFAQTGSLQVKDESVKDTLVDLANYCALLAGYLESKKCK